MHPPELQTYVETELSSNSHEITAGALQQTETSRKASIKSLFSSYHTILDQIAKGFILNPNARKMAGENAMRVTFILGMVVAVALFGSGEGRRCTDECLPVCMQIDGAAREKCISACEGYCEQTEGSTGGCHHWACR
ncbi:hypothetical protein SAY87_027705 [Trapa incisa]|uniref:Uncharacterized protein n=1 Tax=Trapa incisa TaxID=236973 RepID=A0AAN7PKF0_9MYRT|nr:hypothetical protein SAY87_027705 [Trapa incisa]